MSMLATGEAAATASELPSNDDTDGLFGTARTAFTITVKWVVVLRVICAPRSIARRGSFTHLRSTGS